MRAPVRPGEKSSRDWEKAAQQQEEDDEERSKIREMGGSDFALVNILEGSVEDGKIHPVGDRTTGIAVANLTEVGSCLDFFSHVHCLLWLQHRADDPMLFRLPMIFLQKYTARTTKKRKKKWFTGSTRGQDTTATPARSGYLIVIRV